MTKASLCYITLGLLIAGMLPYVQAGAQDLCSPGTDAECARFGKNMCCAYIQYTFQGDSQNFHACASKPGIEYSRGMIYDNFGFAGTWYCAFCNAGLQATLVIAVAFASLLGV